MNDDCTPARDSTLMVESWTTPWAMYYTVCKPFDTYLVKFETHSHHLVDVPPFCWYGAIANTGWIEVGWGADIRLV